MQNLYYILALCSIAVVYAYFPIIMLYVKPLKKVVVSEMLRMLKHELPSDYVNEHLKPCIQEIAECQIQLAEYRVGPNATKSEIREAALEQAALSVPAILVYAFQRHDLRRVEKRATGKEIEILKRHNVLPYALPIDIPT